MQWPGPRPGFAVIVGEEENEDPFLHENHIHIINEIDGGQIIGRDTVGFIRRLAEVREFTGWKAFMETRESDPCARCCTTSMKIFRTRAATVFLSKLRR
jgi:hypothetical protein